jgi:hypothetical protein
MEPWPFWYYRGIWYLVIVIVLLFFTLVQKKIIFSSLKYNSSIFFSIILFSWIYFGKIDGIETLIRFLFKIIIVIYVLMLKESEKRKIIPLFTNIFSIIVGISIFFYILVVIIGIDLPYKTLKHPNNWYPVFRNYLFFVITDESYVLFQRFRSIFTEPGHIGTYAALLLYINKYELRKKTNFIILLGIILSFSLAAYLLTLVGYFICKLNEKRKIYINFMFVLLMGLTVGYLGVYLYNNNNNNLFTQTIINRLQYDEDKGIVGNNRINANFESYYENSFKKSQNLIILGLGDNKVNELSKGQEWVFSGYKGFLVRYGIIGIICVILFYGTIIIHAKSLIIIGLYILYIISFLQRPMMSLHEVEIFLFIGAAEMYKINKCNN